MIALASGIRVYLACGTTDMRKGMTGGAGKGSVSEADGIPAKGWQRWCSRGWRLIHLTERCLHFGDAALG